MSQATPALHILAQARTALADAIEKAQSAHGANNALLVRLTEARAKSSEAARNARDGKIDEGTAVLRMSIADADAKDIEALLAQSTPVLATLDSAVSRAQAQAEEAETGARKEEHQLAAFDLDKHIRELESALLEAIGERHRIFLALNPRSLQKGSTFSYYLPCPALKDLIAKNVAPGM